MATEYCETGEAMQLVSHILLLSPDTFALFHSYSNRLNKETVTTKLQLPVHGS
jgi:hypothetical protein